ncbi:ATPase involved in DNA repair [Achromobacter xylosoxidans]|uniref:ATP-binding protein n=1 Tax=Alcaligenes xylosoxydans xylosoxydans TaxID=85698 RepID=UPI0006C5EC90|nr:ATP-binding protein [Achromobacter xylosoxidans]CUJ75467.1 ATPase involved in DNA repair [Achromobacter xylosoxidans]
MKFLSLKLVARGIHGWESPDLVFGARTTSLHAPNGSGKTPLLQAVAYCLGFASQFREDIREKCQAAVLTFEHDQSTYTLRRDLGNDFHITIQTDESEREFFSEGDFSKALFQEFGMSVPILVANNRQSATPYFSTLLPIFYVRQDGGYNDPYRPPATFIFGQFVEMVRFAFGLGPRRSYNAQRDLIAAREQLDGAQRRLVSQQKIVADMSATIDDSPLSLDRLNQKSSMLTEQIQDIKNSVDAAGAANDAVLDLLQAKEEQIRLTRRQHADLQARLAGIDSIRGEIEGEIQTLSLNEESKRALESFFDICGRADCGLFMTSTESYAKNLMYLKDQIKDLEANAGRAETQLEILKARLADQEQERALIASKVSQPERQNATQQLISSIQALTKELLETEQNLTAIEQLTGEKSKYIELDNERSRIQDRIALFSNNTRSDLEFSKLRLRVRELIVKWMDILNTPNASREIDIDLDFKIKFGTESIDVFTGSTRSRLILAIHAALFEHYLQDLKRPFRFLILDTPKQQELDSKDLGAFLHALQEVCDKFHAQILLSATEYHHPIGQRDVEWLPQFQGAKQLMYLGPIN